ncbi:hypothetical protein EC988_000740 [Linderina pennispora]|nr:hypothetical protein EC988_000740 [Linderina pennispora]
MSQKQGMAAGDLQADETPSARGTADMLRELQTKLETYDSLEQEIAKLAQEQKTLENYVANMMSSTVFT